MEATLSILKRKNHNYKNSDMTADTIPFCFFHLYTRGLPKKNCNLTRKLSMGKKKNDKKKTPKVKHTTLIAPIDKGGLGMVDVHAVHTASNAAGLNDYMETLNLNAKIAH